MSGKYLKPYLHYSDLYDRHTVEMCRRTEKICARPTELPEGSKLDKEEAARVEKAAKKFILYIERGERYINKAKTIQEWMDRDRKRDDFYESAQAPEDIRCLTCRNRLKVIHKDFWYGMDDEEDRVLFMYECPNQCLPRRAFFSNGEEWRVKPRLCLKCDTPLDSKADKTDKKIITTHFCPKCGYEETDEFELSSGKGKPDELDENFGKDRDRFCLTPEEGRDYQEAKWNMEQAGKLFKELDEQDKARQEKLKENPKGFHLDSKGYTCFICRDCTREDGDNWYDEYGIKCLVCQKAVDNGEIPAYVAKDKDSWYSKYDLESKFNLTSPTIRKWVKEGVIKSRVVSKYGKGIHTELFLIEDNKDFLPPKELVKSQSVSTKKDGKVWHNSEPWYRFVDPFEYLKGYKIMDHMRIVPPEEMAAREAEKKKKQEERQARLEQRRLNRSKKKI